MLSEAPDLFGAPRDLEGRRFFGNIHQVGPEKLPCLNDILHIVRCAAHFDERQFAGNRLLVRANIHLLYTDNLAQLLYEMLDANFRVDYHGGNAYSLPLLTTLHYSERSRDRSTTTQSANDTIYRSRRVLNTDHQCMFTCLFLSYIRMPGALLRCCCASHIRNFPPPALQSCL